MTTIDLNKVSFFQPVEGKTLREQLQGKILAGAEVIEYIRSFRRTKGFVPPAHWNDANNPMWAEGFVPPSHWIKAVGSRWVHVFSLTHLPPPPGERRP
ncbi:MAG: hypothetical protein AAB453_01600, partial [Patescibacteria group bacterium]